jgi:hypothetical protein
VVDSDLFFGKMSRIFFILRFRLHREMFRELTRFHIDVSAGTCIHSMYLSMCWDEFKPLILQLLIKVQVFKSRFVIN